MIQILIISHILFGGHRFKFAFVSYFGRRGDFLQIVQVVPSVYNWTMHNMAHYNNLCFDHCCHWTQKTIGQRQTNIYFAFEY